MPEDQRRARQMEVLGLLIDHELMRQFLAKNAPAVAQADVSARLASMDAEMKKQNKSLQDFYRETSQTEAVLRADIAQEMQWEQYAKTHVAEADVQKYYKENKDFFDKILVRASHIVLRVPPNASEADKAKAKAQLMELRAQLVAGKVDFAEAAKKYSQCPSAGNGGDIGLFPRKFMVDEPFARAAFSMKVGDVSDVVQTSYGLHIIKVTERKPGEPSDYAKIKDDVREFCTEETRQSILSEQRRVAKIEITLP
jgi:peptidyl-prolyl cis-trans isomerase C